MSTPLMARNSVSPNSGSLEMMKRCTAIPLTTTARTIKSCVTPALRWSVLLAAREEWRWLQQIPVAAAAAAAPPPPHHLKLEPPFHRRPSWHCARRSCSAWRSRGSSRARGSRLRALETCCVRRLSAWRNAESVNCWCPLRMCGPHQERRRLLSPVPVRAVSCTLWWQKVKTQRFALNRARSDVAAM